MIKYTYKIVGLDCASCAKKIEDSLNKDKNLNNVVVNFATSRISYETDLKEHFSYVNKIIDSVEPEAKMIDNEKVKKEYHFLVLIIALVSALIGYFDFKFHEVFIIISYILLLYNPIIKAIKMLIKSHTINENLLISISAIGAYFVNSKMEGIMVSALYLLGKILEEKAVNKTRDSIHDLLVIKEDYANKKDGDTFFKIPVEEIKIGDILCVKKGEKVPVDGVITLGKAKFDTSALTGESELIEIEKGEKVLSGYLNTEEKILMKSTSIYKESTVAKILELVENASDKKAVTETVVAKFSKIYTPIILILAILTGLLLPLFSNLTYNESIYRALTFLVISCPCAIAISVPLSYFTGIGVASKNGILIKGSNYLDNLSKIKKIIFDKTGTLTTGEFRVLKIEVLDKKYKEDEIIEILRKGESFSNHPIAKSILKLSNKKIDTKDVKEYKEIPGVGIFFKLKNKVVKIGTKKVCDDDCPYNVSIHLNIDSKHIASILIDDGIKKNANLALASIKDMGIKTFMLKT